MVKCIVDEFPFNRQHFFNTIKKNKIFYEGNLRENTTHILFIDIPENAFNMIDEILYYKSLGIEIVYSFYDPYRFNYVDKLIEINLVDKLILFDKKYKDRFNIDTYISDYFVNEDLFPVNKIENIYDRKCYFGNLLNNRNLDDNTDHLIIDEFEILYKKVQQYKKVVVFDTGRLMDGTIINHNKAKFIESIMCGVPAQCDKYIDTINYNTFLNNDNISIELIRNINQKVIKDFINIFK